MARLKKTTEKKKSNGASLGFEATLWAMADKQRGIAKDMREARSAVWTLA